MNMFGISPHSFQVLRNTLRQQPQIEKVILFGSRAKGNYKKGSDIDLAVKGTKCTPQLVWDLKAYLNENTIIPYYIDLISYDHIDTPELKAHIDSVGIEIPVKP